MAEITPSARSEPRILWRVSLFAAVLSAAGMPLYIHLPLFAETELGLDLTTVGFVLLALRAFDFVQDPFLGRLVDRLPEQGWLIAASSLAGMGIGFFLLFSVAPPIPPTAWLVLTLALIFTSYSLASILFYARGVTIAKTQGGHLRVAGFREGGLLAGILIGTIAPTLFEAARPDPYAGFGIMLLVLSIAAIPLSAPLWRIEMSTLPAVSFKALLTPTVRQFLLVGLVNTLPVAFTSTLFLLFVRDQLELPVWSGVFLLVFFLAAGLAAPLWTTLAARHDARPVLLGAMTLAVASFIWASLLGAGDGTAFLLICALSGATMSADIIILPALFSQRLARHPGGTGIGFGLWNFVTKMAFALAAGLIAFAGMLGPALSDASVPPTLTFLTIGYALVPCLLKILAIMLIYFLPAFEVNQ